MKEAGPTREGFWSGRDDQSDVLDETMVHSADAALPEPRITLAPGTAVSRYVILYEVGAGGMGVVYAAFDPELNRKIALKILTPKAAPDPYEGARKSKIRQRSADQAAARLMREAQAIARLSHPNVVTVYDVGRHGEAVFVAMEFIEGRTLTKWLEHEPRSLDEIRGVFALAGRGLVAAHDAGLVHRDFKPDNVLVGTDGRVRVLDFGLARADPTHASQLSHVSNVSNPSGGANDDDPGDGVPQMRDFGESDVLSSPLTLDDAVVGTPRYMAPEQHAGVGVDARSDQFSFCVALYQALWVREPFAAERLHELVRLKQLGQVTPIPSDSRVPPWLEELVLRGLSPRPAARWPSMHELVAALEQDSQAKRRRWLGLTGAAVLLAAVTAAVGHQLGGGERPCQDGAGHLVGLWDESRREALGGAILGTGLPYAEHTWAEVERRVQADLDGWVATYRDTCEATRVRGEQSDELLDLRMTCLRDHLNEVRAVLDVLAEPDAAVVQRAVAMVSALPGLEGCADAEQLRARLPPPQDEATRTKVEALRQALRQAGARKAVRRVDEARSQVEEVLAAAETLGYEPLRIEALAALGVVLEQAGDFTESEARLREALWAALRVGHDAVAGQVAIQLVSVVGDRLARYDEGLMWAEQAAALLDRVGEEGLPRGNLLNNVGNVWHRKGDNEQALSYYQRAIALREQLEGADGPNLANERINLGNAQLALGQHDAALQSYRDAEVGLRSALGEGHPQIAMAVASIGLVYSTTGRYAEAVAQQRRALPDFEAWLGPDHLFVATTILNIGEALRQLGELTEAEAQLRRAQQLFEKSLGPDHPQVAACLYGLGEIRGVQKRLDEAQRLHQRALELRGKRYPEDHEDVVVSQLALAGLSRLRGDAAGAVSSAEALAMVGERADLDPALRGRIHLELAQARWDEGQEWARVRADVERARVFLREAGVGGETTLRELESWDREHAKDDRAAVPPSLDPSLGVTGHEP